MAEWTKDDEAAIEMAADGALNEAGALAEQIIKLITKNLRGTPMNQLAALTALAACAAVIVKGATIPDPEDFFVGRFKNSLQQGREGANDL